MMGMRDSGNCLVNLFESNLKTNIRCRMSNRSVGLQLLESFFCPRDSNLRGFVKIKIIQKSQDFGCLINEFEVLVKMLSFSQ